MAFGSGEALGGVAAAALRRDPLGAATTLADGAATAATQSAQSGRLHAAAAEFEKTFLAEMLKNAGLDDAVASADSGFGADAYRSFLVDAYAGALAEQNSFGFAESLYESLRARLTADAQTGGVSDVA